MLEFGRGGFEFSVVLSVKSGKLRKCYGGKGDKRSDALKQLKFEDLSRHSYPGISPWGWATVFHADISSPLETFCMATAEVQTAG